MKNHFRLRDDAHERGQIMTSVNVVIQFVRLVALFTSLEKQEDYLLKTILLS